MTFNFSSIDLQVHDGIAVLALNRPEVRNAIDDAMRGELTTRSKKSAATPPFAPWC